MLSIPPLVLAAVGSVLSAGIVAAVVVSGGISNNEPEPVQASFARPVPPIPPGGGPQQVEFTPKVSDYQRRVWIWVDNEAIPEANDLITDINNGPAWEADNTSLRGGSIAGWSLTPTDYAEVITRLTPLITAGSVQVSFDQHGNLDSSGRELTAGEFSSRASKEDVVDDRKVVFLEREIERLIRLLTPTPTPTEEPPR
jgi:hypothetical protein